MTLLVWSLIEAPSHGMAVWGAIAFLFLPARSREEDPISIALEREPLRQQQLEPVVERVEG